MMLPDWVTSGIRPSTIDNFDEALVEAVRFVFWADDLCSQKRASKFAAAAWFLAAQEVRPEAVRALLKKRGLEKLARMAASLRKQDRGAWKEPVLFGPESAPEPTIVSGSDQVSPGPEHIPERLSELLAPMAPSPAPTPEPKDLVVPVRIPRGLEKPFERLYQKDFVSIIARPSTVEGHLVAVSVERIVKERDTAA